MKNVRIDKKTINNQPDLFPQTSGNARFFSPESDKPKTTIGETEREFANVEAEKGESLLTADGDFFTISGKKHSQGGTPLSLSEGDFIFSDKLKVKGKEIVDIFPHVQENKKYSYSDLSKKFGKKLNYFNEQLNSDDDITRDTAELMQANIKSKLGEISILQEASKGFPQGLPAPAQNFFQVGGVVPYTGGKTLSPTGRNTNYDRKIDYDLARLKMAGFDVAAGNQGVQQQLYDRLLGEDPAELAYMWANFGDTAKGGSKQTFRNIFGDPSRYTSKEAYKQAVKEKFGSPENLMNEVSKYRGSFSDGLWGARSGYLTELFAREPQPTTMRRDLPPIGSPAIGRQVTPRTLSTGMQQPNFFTPTTTIPPIADPQAGNTVTQNDPLRLSLPDTVSLANSVYNAATIDKQMPTRYENYGIPQAMGIISNIRPYDYQSQINEVNKTLNQAASAVNAYSRTPQEAAANISALYGQSLEATSRIRGAEYNANAQLYNNNAAQLAQYAVSRGADLALNAQAYNEKVDAVNQNFYEDSVRARNAAVQSGIQGYINAVNVNAVNQVNPNYKIDPYSLKIGFRAPTFNPLTGGGIPQANYFSPVSAFNNNLEALKSQYPEVPEKTIMGIARSITRWKPQEYQDDLYGRY